MPYTLAVLKESLRRYSVVPVVTRELKEDDQLGEHLLPAGTLVAVSLQVRRPGGRQKGSDF
jgi:cytochrome P450